MDVDVEVDEDDSARTSDRDVHEELECDDHDKADLVSDSSEEVETRDTGDAQNEVTSDEEDVESTSDDDQSSNVSDSSASSVSSRRSSRSSSSIDNSSAGNSAKQMITAVEYSSDLPQSARDVILRKFRAGEIHVLICSDLIARGIDLDCVEAVINYDVPDYMKKYIHRVGRTARAGRGGVAYSLVEEQEAYHFKRMLAKMDHLGAVKKVNVDRQVLDPMREVYQHSLDTLKEYMTRSRPSVARYQRTLAS